MKQHIESAVEDLALVLDLDQKGKDATRVVFTTLANTIHEESIQKIEDMEKGGQHQTS